MFLKYAAAIALLVMCLPGYAQTSTGDVAPSVIHAPIHYPRAAVWAQEQGTVLVKAQVGTDGRALNVAIDQSSGHADLDVAALQSISQWSFSPGTKDGRPQTQWIRVPVAFQLTTDAADVFSSRGNLLTITGFLVGCLGSLVWTIGFIWSIVLAKRKSILWLSGMVALWAVTYPLFVALNWSVARRNLICVGLGIALLALGIYIMPPQRMPI
jgi:TonB family protein